MFSISNLTKTNQYKFKCHWHDKATRFPSFITFFVSSLTICYCHLLDLGFSKDSAHVKIIVQPFLIQALLSSQLFFIHIFLFYYNSSMSSLSLAQLDIKHDTVVRWISGWHWCFTARRSCIQSLVGIRDPSLWNVHILLLPVWIFSKYSSFLSQTKTLVLGSFRPRPPSQKRCEVRLNKG